MKIAIIGSAGQEEDGPRMNRTLYLRMVAKAWDTICDYCDDVPGIGTNIDLVSGGAAWADHIAVSLYLMGRARSLTLHMPAQFDGNSTPTHDEMVASYYHRIFSEKMGEDTLDGIIRAIAKGAHDITHDGFHTRSLAMGDVDFLLAFTFGTCSYYGPPTPSLAAGLKSGGTAHTWNGSPAPFKRHINLHYL